jgi:hypothetical protein
MGFNNHCYENYCWTLFYSEYWPFPLTIPPPETQSIIIPKTPYGAISQWLFNPPVTLSNPPLLKPFHAENAEISQGWYVALKSTKTIKFNYSIFSIRHFTTSTSSIGTSCPLIFHISLVSEPHLDVYIQLEYLARSAYYIACWQGSWDCSFAVYGLIMVYVFLFFFKKPASDY